MQQDPLVAVDIGEAAVAGGGGGEAGVVGEHARFGIKLSNIYDARACMPLSTGSSIFFPVVLSISVTVFVVM